MINVEETLKRIEDKIDVQGDDIRAIRLQLDSLAEGEEDPDLSLDDLPEVDSGLIPLKDEGLG